MEPFKISVPTEELSVLCQKILFGKGCGWGIDDVMERGKQIRHSDEPFLFINRHGRIGYSGNADFFLQHSSKEISFSSLTSLPPKEK